MRSATAGTRPASSLANRLRHALGMRQTVVIDGVRYREARAESLRRALMRSGSGGKDYVVTFTDGTSMPIRCTVERVYADLMGPRLLAAVRAADGLIRPGTRVLLWPAGTGYLASWLSLRLSRSGALVTLEDDEESARYAQRRYPLAGVAHEHGDTGNLAGETDGAFDAAISVRNRTVDAVDELNEVWRVTREWLLVGWPAGERSVVTALERLEGVSRREELTADGWSLAVAHRDRE